MNKGKRRLWSLIGAAVFCRPSNFLVLVFLLIQTIQISQAAQTPKVEQPKSFTRSSSGAPWKETPNEIPLKLMVVDNLGHIENPEYKITSQWLWKKSKSLDREQIYLRVDVLFSTDIKVSVLAKDQEKRQIDGSNRLVADLSSLPGSISISYESDKGKKDLSLVVVSANNDPIFAIHKSCSDYNIEIQNVRRNEEFYWGQAICKETEGDSVEVIVSTSAPFQIISKNGNFQNLSDLNKQEAHLTIPKEALKTSGSLGNFFIASHNFGSSVHQIVYSEPNYDYKSLGFSFGAGLTYASYNEPSLAVDHSELGVSLKASSRVSLIPKKLDLDGNAFAMVAPINFSTSAAPAHFLGANFRIGYQLPIRWFGLNWQPSVGGYIWKMIVPDQSYGISLLSGPQGFLTVRSDPKRKRPFYVYIKYALMADTDGSFALDKREIASGGGIALTRLKNRPLSLTLDVAQMSMKSIDGINGFTLLTTSLGLALSL